MPKLTVILGDQAHTIEVPLNFLLGDAIAQLELPLEQPCAGRGTCGKCKVLNEGGMLPPDEIEREHLTAGELAVGNRLACRARIAGDARVVLAPIVVYSNKSFKASNRYKKERDVPLGLAIDLGSTTVAAFLTMLDNGEVCAGTAALNQQSVYGADVISRLDAAHNDPAPMRGAYTAWRFPPSTRPSIRCCSPNGFASASNARSSSATRPCTTCCWKCLWKV
jgi:uncharacterized 2Fe-2S/4Fe-4S cluster protein (DUF4445 family)